MFEEGLAAGGKNYTEAVLMEAPLKATAARQEDAGGQGRHVCPWAACVGQWPAANSMVAFLTFLG